jgi:hypothetical protein
MERIPWLDIIHFLLWNEWFFYFHFNCQCQISWNHDFWLSFIQSSSVTLHLWSQYIWYMAWLEVWPFSWSVLISGELLYHIEKTVRLVLWVLNTTINNISYVISWQVSLNDGKNTMVRHHPLPIVKWVVFLFSL